MLSHDTKIMKCNQYQKSDEAPIIIYANLGCIIEKINGCKYNPEKSSSKKVNENFRSGFSMPTISSFRGIENRHEIYRGKDCMQKFCESLR